MDLIGGGKRLTQIETVDEVAQPSASVDVLDVPEVGSDSGGDHNHVGGQSGSALAKEPIMDEELLAEGRTILLLGQMTVDVAGNAVDNHV